MSSVLLIGFLPVFFIPASSSDLETTVEDLRNDILNKRCRVNKSEVDTMALALSNISRNLGDLKGNLT